MPNIEELLLNALEEGKFDNLPGKGKPLHLEESNPHALDWELAYHVIKESGYTLPWIETLHEIEKDLDKLPADKNAKIILYCRSGRMSAIAAETMVRLGYTNVWNTEGGMIAWETLGLPLKTK